MRLSYARRTERYCEAMVRKPPHRENTGSSPLSTMHNAQLRVWRAPAKRSTWGLCDDHPEKPRRRAKQCRRVKRRISRLRKSRHKRRRRTWPRPPSPPQDKDRRAQRRPAATLPALPMRCYDGCAGVAAEPQVRLSPTSAAETSHIHASCAASVSPVRTCRSSWQMMSSGSA